MQGYEEELVWCWPKQDDRIDDYQIIREFSGLSIYL